MLCLEALNLHLLESMKKPTQRICVLLFLFFIAVSSVANAQRKITKKVEKYDRKGKASFYHDRFEGQLTASGEIFHQNKLTAASNTLPLGSYVKVTNLKNKKTVVVRINDRMSKHNNRLIDLSKKAAKKLDFIDSGLIRVRVEYISDEQP